jgi:carbamoylphosphate synthase large subunit
MNAIRRFTVAKIVAELAVGEVQGEFETENEAWAYAYQKDPTVKWVVLPIVKFAEYNDGIAITRGMPNQKENV